MTPHACSINDFFQRVVVINLDRRRDRWKQVCRSFQYAKIEAQRFAAIDGRAPDTLAAYREYACRPPAVAPPDAPIVGGYWEIARGTVSRQAALAYLEQDGQKAIGSPGAWAYLKTVEVILRRALADGIQTLLVFDDDVLIHRASQQLFSNAVAELPKDWCVFLLGVMQHNWHEASIVWSSSSLYSSRCGAIGSHAVGLRSDAFLPLLSEIERMDMPYDIGALSTVMRAMPNYIVYPNIAIQRIEGNVSDVQTSKFLLDHSTAFIADTFRWPLGEYE
jgi:GR25 family glycosyltransferase involved in LPS biosynthesis